MRRSAFVLAAPLVCCVAFAQAPSDPKSKAAPPAALAHPHVKAGGVELTLPGPAAFAEVGDKLRTTIFELMAPASNRLLTAYVPAKNLDELNQGQRKSGLDFYALVEVPRQAEYMDCTPEAFSEVSEGMASSMGSFSKENVAQIEQDTNIRLKSLGAKPLEVGRPEMLGGLFQNADSFGFGMLVAIKQNERSVTMAAGIGVVRVRQRLLFAYLYHVYESPESVSWVRTNLATWVGEI